MPRTSDARQRALVAAERLFREQGYAATGLAEILAASGAPKGSFYFHFPDGKSQLAREVLDRYGERVRMGLAALARQFAGDPAGFVGAVVVSIVQEMEASGWRLGCAVQNIAAETVGSDPALAAQAAAVFEGWLDVLAEGLSGPAPAPRREALRLLAGLEGARTLARLSGSAEPFEAVAADWDG